MYTFEKSREYFYGERQEFLNRESAEHHANYKKEAMLQEIKEPIVKSEIDDDSRRLQVIITVDRQ